MTATMSDVALYGHWICPFATRVQFALHQRGVDHEVIDLPPSAVRPRDFVLPPEFVEHSPKLEIPMVRVGDDYLADSIPVLEWLETVVPGPPLLPAAEADRALVRERMAWIDQHAFRPMVGVYYGIDPDRLARASAKLGAALEEMGSWTVETGWLAGDGPTLAEAVAMPIHVRLAGLQRLGFTAAVDPAWTAHGDRCRELAGWSAVEWSAEQTDEFVARFETFRRKQERAHDA
ncbi:MAG: glutathione S-transferase family protein [Actinomycetota bacterium]